ncbi:MAG: hypothetical protein JSW61_03670 [Candidatus Thorarchaeota archaeon]|nr:MAG: hypothetical protein JSW61_03670 [Candidatus Thorarchaeota archaeon]
MANRLLPLSMLTLFVVSLWMMPVIPRTQDGAMDASQSRIGWEQQFERIQVPADYPENYTHVQWEQGYRNEAFNESVDWSEWMFGPSITWKVRNSTTKDPILIDDTIEIDGWADYRLKIPKSALSGSLPYAVAFAGQFVNISTLVRPGPEPETQIGLIALYEVQNQTWHVYSSYNATFMGPEAGPPEELPADWSLEDIFGPPLNPFLEIDANASNVVIGPENIWVEFTLRFNSSSLPGVYGFHAVAMDNELEPLAQSMDDELSVRAVGITFDEVMAIATGGYYDWTRVDDDGNLIYSATRGVDFNMTASVIGPSLDNVSVLIDLPERIRKSRYVDGPYSETTNYTGGWVFDRSSGIYIWNASIKINHTITKYGLHWETELVWLDLGFEFDYWNPRDAKMERGFTWGKMAVVYWFANNSFGIRLAYGFPEFEWIPEWGDWEERERFEFYPWPQDGSIPMPYTLNTTGSEYRLVGNSHIVNFRGHISDVMVPTGVEFGAPRRVQELVYSTDGKRLTPSSYLPTSESTEQVEYEALHQLSIETPISIVQLLKKGQPFEPSWMFVVDKQETFTVKSRLQGGADYADDIDGVALVLYSFDHKWGFEAGYEWSQDTEVEMIVGVAPDGTTDVSVYNMTRRTSWGFGGHWEEQYIEVFPNHWEWRQVWVESDYWKEQFWDFTKNDWSDEWIPYHSKETVMSVNYVDVGNPSYEVLGNDLRVLFDVTPSAEMPELEWEWYYIYGNLTVVTDYEAGWGEHMVLGWVQEPVYSYMNSTERVYTEAPYKSLSMRNNDTLAYDEVYPVEASPYIFVDNQTEFVRTIVVTDETGFSEERVVFEEWNSTAYNPETGDYSGYWSYYYELLNGTRIPIKGGKYATVFNISLPDTRWFLSFNDFPYYAHWMEPLSIEYMIAINGTVVYQPAGSFIVGPPVLSKIATEVGLVALVNGTYPVFMATEPIWKGDHYVFFENGSWEEYRAYEIMHPKNGMFYYAYFNQTDGLMYWFYDGIWPHRAFRVEHLGKYYFVAEPETRFLAFTDMAGYEEQLPFPGAPPVGSIWELNYVTERVLHVYIEGGWHRPIYMGDFLAIPTPEVPIPYTYPFYVANVSGTLYNLTWHGSNPMEPWNPNLDDPRDFPWVSIANGSIRIPDLIHHDWTVAYGQRDLQTWEFIVEGWINLLSGDYIDQGTKRIFNDDLGYEYVITESGQKLNHTWQDRVYFYNITLSNGTFFYSGDPWVQTFGNETLTPDGDSFLNVSYYYMYDFNGSRVTWDEWMDFTAEVVPADDFNGTSFPAKYLFNGTWWPLVDHNLAWWDAEGLQWVDNWMEPVRHDSYLALVNATHSLEIVDIWEPEIGHLYNIPSFNFTLNQTTWFDVTGSLDLIHKAYKVWGYGKKVDYAPLPVTIVRHQGSIVIGAPKWGMWDIKSWETNPSSGAIDLDGNLQTEDDQYFVKKSFEAMDTYNITEQYLWITILWEPNNTVVGDEFFVESYTGLYTVNWTSDWSDNFYWFDAETGDPVSPSQWAAINSTLFDQEGRPRPGYWDIAWMAENFTKTDLKQMATDEGWDWAVEDSQEWSWIWWELYEHYGTEYINNTETEYVSVDVWHEFAGMLAWNDTNSNNVMDVDPSNLDDSELTHYWMPIGVDGVTFTTPNGSAIGNDFYSVNASIPFGVAFENVSGAVFPFGDYSYWDWYQGQYYGSDFSTFDERPSGATTDSFEIGVEFEGNITNASNNKGEVKFNLTVGEWDVDAPGGRSVLAGRSLGVAFYSHVTMRDENGTLLTTQYVDDLGQKLTNNATASSQKYNVSMGAAEVASMNLGGQPYTWSKIPSANYTVVDAQTVPVRAFEAAYRSDAGGSATSFKVMSAHFYTIINFRWWGGYEISVDPVFVGYSSSQGISDTLKPSLDSLDTEVKYVNSKEQLHFEVAASDIGGSGVAEVRVMDDSDKSNTSLTYNGDTELWTGYVQMVGSTHYIFNYTVVVLDYAGNENSTALLSHDFWNDPFDPELSSLGISSGDSLQSYVTISVVATDIGPSDIDYVDIYLVNTDETRPMTFNSGNGKWEVNVSRTSGAEYDLQYILIAYDNAGNFVQSSTQTYHFNDIIEPNIASVTGTMLNISGIETLLVEASVSDSGGSGLSTVQLTWTNGSDPNVVDMTYNPSTFMWEYEIPNHNPGIWIFYTVTATDGQGNSKTSVQDSYMFTTEGDSAPGIGLFSVDPTQPTSSDAVTISVTVVDDYSVKNVTLYYRVDGGSWNGLVMSAAGDTYSAIIPAQPDGSFVEYYIVAYDNLDQMSQTSTASYSVNDGDLVAPQIQTVSIDLPSPTSADAVTITAMVVDDVGIANVTLYYQVDGGEWITILMTADGDEYSAVIPPQADGSIVTYFVRAYDTAGNSADSAQQQYLVADETTTTTTTTTETTTTTTGPTEPLPEGGPLSTTIIATFVGMLLLVVILGGLRRRRQ